MQIFLGFPATSLPFLCEPSGPCSRWLRQATTYTTDGGEKSPLHCEETVSCCPRSHIQWVGKRQGLEGFEKKKTPIVSYPTPLVIGVRVGAWMNFLKVHLCSVVEISV